MFTRCTHAHLSSISIFNDKLYIKKERLDKRVGDRLSDNKMNIKTLQ